MLTEARMAERSSRLHRNKAGRERKAADCARAKDDMLKSAGVETAKMRDLLNGEVLSLKTLAMRSR
jgi:hypothetical protein